MDKLQTAMVGSYEVVMYGGESVTGVKFWIVALYHGCTLESSREFRNIDRANKYQSSVIDKLVADVTAD